MSNCERKSELISWLSQIGLAIVMLVTVAFVSGCHRGYYRRQADAEAQRLIREKSFDPRWNGTKDAEIDIDPMSRMFDPFSSDHPPLPPDDPTSHQLMHRINGHRGYPHWHANGDTNFVENPEWESYLPVNDKGQVVLDLATAFQLAQIHSTDLQQQRETLYLSALDVSLERFGFDSQLFSGFNSFLTGQGSFRGGDTTLANSLGQNGQGNQLSRLGITGATLAVGIANSIIWNFGGANTQSATSLIDFSIVQPLLRNAGRSRILEALTQSERTLLANVRQMDRFRRGFYLEIVTGGNAGAGPNLGGNFLGAPAGGPTGVGGYLGLLQQQQQIRIQEFNVSQLQNVLDQFREFFARERINAFQVRLFEGTLYNQQDSLLRLKRTYQSQLDDFKAALGLPPRLELIIRDPYLDRFEFISDEILMRQGTINSLRSTAGEQLNLIDDLLPDSSNDVEQPGFEWPEAVDQQISALMPFIDQALRYIDQLEDVDKTQIENDFETLERVRPRRLSYLKDLRGSIARGEIDATVEPMIFKATSVVKADDLRQEMARVLMNLKRTKQSIKAIQDEVTNFSDTEEELGAVELYEFTKESIVQEVSERLTEIYNAALELSLLQAQARGNSIELPEVDLNDRQALSIARCFRRDWMNARATLIDEWREIEFVADQLEGELDVVFSGEIGNISDNPFQLRGANGELSAGIQFDSPIVRLSERNQYRQTLIEYQQAKRAFYQFRDTVHSNLRDTLRNINLNKILFELGRQNIQVAIEQVESARLALEDPSATSLGATTARDLTDAINGLQNAQTSFLDVFVTHEVLRRGLDFELGTFQIGPDGTWIDPEIIDPNVAERAAAMMGVDLSEQCFCDLNSIFEETTTIDSEFIDEEMMQDEPVDLQNENSTEDESQDFQYERESQGSQTQGSQTREPINDGIDDSTLEGTELPADQEGRQLNLDYDRPRGNPFSDPQDQSWRNNGSRPGELIVPSVEIPANQATSIEAGPQVDPEAFKSNSWQGASRESTVDRFVGDGFAGPFDSIPPAANSSASVRTSEYSFEELPTLDGKEVPTFIPAIGLLHSFEIFPTIPASFENAVGSSAPRRGDAELPKDATKQSTTIRLRAVPEKSVIGK